MMNILPKTINDMINKLHSIKSKTKLKFHEIISD